MKKTAAVILCLLLSLVTCACRKDKNQEPEFTGPIATPEPTVYELEVSLENIYDYFEFRQYPTYFKDDNGNVSSVQISYGLALKEGYYAADPEEYEHTMRIKFTAEGVVNSGDFSVDYNTLQYGGTIYETSYTTVSESLKFWPKGNRTTTWTFGNYSSSYIMYFQSFAVTEAEGSVFITVGQPPEWQADLAVN